jgi:hypothetical protein
VRPGNEIGSHQITTLQGPPEGHRQCSYAHPDKQCTSKDLPPLFLSLYNVVLYCPHLPGRRPRVPTREIIQEAAGIIPLRTTNKQLTSHILEMTWRACNVALGQQGRNIGRADPIIP